MFNWLFELTHDIQLYARITQYILIDSLIYDAIFNWFARINALFNWYMHDCSWNSMIDRLYTVILIDLLICAHIMWFSINMHTQCINIVIDFYDFTQCSK